MLNALVNSDVVLPAGSGFRLPTEAEWEYACRAGTIGAFNEGSQCAEPEGNDPALEWLAWHSKNSEGEIHPVGTKYPNAWGLYDMHGNVWEWCHDRAEYVSHGTETDVWTEGVVDPVGKQGAWRVFRGGGAWDFARGCRSAHRNAGEPGSGGWFLGFRLAAGPELPNGAEIRLVGRTVVSEPAAPTPRTGAE